MIGVSILKLIPEDRQEEEPQIIARLKQGERVDHFETKRLTSEGKLVDFSLTISPIRDTEGNITGVSKIARDISEKKQDEVRKNDFIGMVSHELKTPLTSLSALIQVLNQKLQKSEDAFVPSALEKANIQVKKMSSMINGFLNIARLESGKIQIEKQYFNLDDLIVEAIDEAKLTVSGHVFNFEPCEPLTVFADREKIGSVLSNLLSNAVKYSPKGKLVTIKCEVVSGSARVSVQDEGMGIKPHDLNKLFERYYRVTSNHTQHISGFGIGLYLSAEIIERQDGKIWAESESGKGSTFFFSLPLEK
jgi:signal transduction histidine kinase